MTISGRIEELNRAAEEIEQKLDELPEGTLLLEKERIRWKLPGNRRVTLSAQNDFALIAALAEKSYLQKAFCPLTAHICYPVSIIIAAILRRKARNMGMLDEEV